MTQVRSGKVFSASLGLCGFLLLGCAGATPAEMAASYVEAGQEAARGGDHAQAIELYARAVAQNPELAVAYYERAYSNLQLRRTPESPGSGRAYEDRALLDYSQAIRINPAYADAYFNRAMILSSRAQYKAAAEDLLKASSSNEKDPEPHFWLGQLYERYFEDMSVQAFDHYEKYADLGGKDPEALRKAQFWKERKRALKEQGKPKASTPEDEKKAADLHENFKRLFAAGQKDEAVKAMEELVTKYASTQYVRERSREFNIILNALKKQ